ncbi:MAG TPA: beta-eliminating lyase-related protein, partial [Actinomycetota bacterium]|nr:beta-eliminating lyase-related protein [Actinomycetota bacterium]
ALQPDAYRMRAVDLVCVENTSQAGGGSVLSPEALGAIRAAADAVGVPLYLDGARIFNAAAASGTEVGAFAAEAEALMFSVSKGLGAPVGSLLCGPAPLIEEARRIRLQLGGGWRQAGVLAAAALVALEEGPPLLPGDHERARRLAEGIAEATPGAVDPDRVETNIVYLDVQDGAGVVARLSERGVRAGFVGGRVRMVTHRDVDDRGIDAALEAWRAVSARRGA